MTYYVFIANDSTHHVLQTREEVNRLVHEMTTDDSEYLVNHSVYQVDADAAVIIDCEAGDVTSCKNFEEAGRTYCKWSHNKFVFSDHLFMIVPDEDGGEYPAHLVHVSCGDTEGEAYANFAQFYRQDWTKKDWAMGEDDSIEAIEDWIERKCDDHNIRKVAA